MTAPGRPTRRRFLQTTGALAAGSLLAGGVHGSAPQASPFRPAAGRLRRPNILLILVDEMRYPPFYEAAGARAFRNEYLLTQRQLLETGVEFRRHYAASTACAPSRTSIFTGQYPSLHGVTQTTGAAKEANDPDVFWLDPDSVPTMGDWFRAAGYRTLYKGKWHISDADLQTPGTHAQIRSYDDQGNRDPAKEKLYGQAGRLRGYGFEGWIGPEPHGKAPLNTGSSPASGMGRDQGFASQCVEAIERLDGSADDTPFLLVASFVNPHDISLWGYAAQHTGKFDFSVESIVPTLAELFDPALFDQTLNDDLATKPSCQESYQTSYHQWMQGIPPDDYFRFYYQLQKNVDGEMGKVLRALQGSRFYQDTIVVFTSDHGDLLGSHRYMHQKWYQTYDEALRVPLIVSSPKLVPGATVDHVTSHVDLLPTLLGLAGFSADELFPKASVDHTDALPLVGRDLSQLVLDPAGPAGPSTKEPIFFMTDDDPSRGLDQDNFYGIAYDSVKQSNHIESVIVELDGHVWKYSRYFDNVQFWSDVDPSGTSKDVVTKVEDPPLPPGEYTLNATVRVKQDPAPEEYEMYDVTQDPMELDNLVHDPAFASMRATLAQLLDEQRRLKRLRPISGDVPGQPT